MHDTPATTGYYRTGFQVALLQLCSLGLYFPYWLIRSRAVANRRLDRPPTPWFFWLMLFVPIVFFYPLFSTLSLLQRSCKKNIRPRVNFVFLGVIFGILTVCWRYPGTYDLLGLLTIVPLGLMQFYSYAVDVTLSAPSADRLRLHWIEKLIVVLGIALVPLTILGSFSDSANANFSPTPGFIAIAVDLAFLIWLRRSGGFPTLLHATRNLLTTDD